MSTAHRGHVKIDNVAGLASTAAAPQCRQCLLPMNIMPKQDGHAMVASFDSQYWHFGESDEIAAPQLGQFRVCACMMLRGHLAAATLPSTANYFLLKNAGRINEA